MGSTPLKRYFPSNNHPAGIDAGLSTHESSSSFSQTQSPLVTGDVRHLNPPWHWGQVPRPLSGPYYWPSDAHRWTLAETPSPSTRSVGCRPLNLCSMVRPLSGHCSAERNALTTPKTDIPRREHSAPPMFSAMLLCATWSLDLRVLRSDDFLGAKGKKTQPLEFSWYDNEWANGVPIDTCICGRPFQLIQLS